MVQGFETRDNTDVPVRALVESAKGHMWKKERNRMRKSGKSQ